MVIFQDKQYSAEAGETVLDCLLRHGVDVPHSCRSGVCQTCMMRMLRGTPDSDSQAGLKPSLVNQNYFLPCRCKAEQTVEVALPDTASFRFPTTVSGIDMLTREIIRLRLERPHGFEYHAGQFITLYNAEGVGRSYSLASVPVMDPFLELHIRLVPKGTVSGWVHKSLAVGDTVSISEAMGNCFYVADDPGKPLLLVGSGSGLAPLFGIVRDALHHGHRGAIKLYHGSGRIMGIYLQQELRQLAQNHSNFQYTACVSQSPTSQSPTKDSDVVYGRASNIALQENPQLSGWRAYICGEPAMVNDTSRALFLAGVSLKEIYSDPFIPSKP